MPLKSLPRLPIGEASFENLRIRRCLYCDKTALIYQLTLDHPYCLLTRPRRFGKSLLLSTLYSLFKSGVTYFSDLYIEKVWDEPLYKVLNLDFSRLDTQSTERLDQSLSGLIRESAMENALDISNWPIASAKQALIEFKIRCGKQRMVILIDEYDAPILANQNHPQLQRQITERLADFFNSLKGAAKGSRFVMLCGVTRNTLSNEYSSMNFLTDISLESEYAALTGFTEKELTKTFEPYLTAACSYLKLSMSALLAEIRTHYDGYAFDPLCSVKVYNNWSILNFLNDKFFRFSNYWYETGKISSHVKQYLIEQSQTSEGTYFSVLMEKLAQGHYLSITSLRSAPDFKRACPLISLFYTGYLTVQGTDNVHSPAQLCLGIPNLEIASALARLYSSLILRQDNADETVAMFTDVLSALHDFGHLEHAVSKLNALYNTFSYDAQIFSREALLRDIFYLAGVLSACQLAREVPNSRGRSDLELSAAGERLVFEFKLARTDSESGRLLIQAVQQLTERAYGKTLPMMATLSYVIVFSQESRKIVRICALRGSELLGSYPGNS